MDAARYQQIKGIFQRALELEPAARRAFVDDACGSDHELRADVDRLLEHAAATGIVDHAIEEVIPASSAAPVAEDGRLGAYRLSRLVGRGGMGAVYEAWRADDQYEQRVAVKVIDVAAESPELLQRFRQERQILATLAHPNIARLLDGGVSSSGRPYLVMEFIDGVPIDEYCSQRALSVRARVQLFGAVCAAVQYAHQNLIVHRDLKPRNILVTPDGTVKLLDFGIAKLLGEAPAAASATAAGLHLMTPEYASPEQIRGEPITTATDVFSLGVVLYELLTGRRPFTAPQRFTLERAICGEEPTRPSAASIVDFSTRSGGTGPPRTDREIARDLDNIILMALRKEPERRYASVEQLRNDLEAFLDDRPVRAHQPTTAYRARKFVRRHRVGVAAACLIVLTLLGGIAATTRAMRVAQAERARAERRFNDLRRLANVFVFDVHDAIQDLTGATPARELIVKRALEYLDSLAAEARDDRGLQRELAAAYLRVGDVQGSPANPNLGDVAGAVASYDKALRLFQSAWHSDQDDPESFTDLSSAFSRLATVQDEIGDKAVALASRRQALVFDERVATARPGDRAAQLALAESSDFLATTVARTGDMAEALKLERRGVTILEALTRAQPDDEKAVQALARADVNLGRLLLQAGDTAAGIDAMRKSMELWVSQSAAHPERASLRRRWAVSVASLADARAQSGDRTGALAGVEEALSLFRGLAESDPVNTGAQRDLALTFKRQGDLLTNLDRPGDAMSAYRSALAIREQLVQRDPANATWQNDLMVTNNDLADTLGNPDFPNLGDRAGALKLYRRGLEIAERLAADGSDAEAQADLWLSRNKIADMLAVMGNDAAALSEYEKALPIAAALSHADDANSNRQQILAITHAALGRTLTRLHRYADAERELGDAQRLGERLVAADAANAEFRRQLAAIYADSGELFMRRALAGRRASDWRAALTSYTRSSEEWHRLADVAALNTVDGSRAAAVERNLERCRRAVNAPPGGDAVNVRSPASDQD